jgi:hypothetical protein
VSIASLINRPCTITHRSEGEEKNEYGNAAPKEETIETVCELQQTQGFRSESEDQVSDNRWLLILPAGTSVGAADTVTIDGDDYEFLAAPWPARNPRTGTASHIEATVCRTAAMGDGA